MPRFSLRLRPKYGENEQTGPEKFRDAIGEGLNMYKTKLDADRAEENEMARQGATRIDDEEQPGPMDRLRSIGDGLKRMIGRGPQATQPFMPQQVERPDISVLAKPQVPGRGPATVFVDPSVEQQGVPVDGGRPLPFQPRSPGAQLEAATRSRTDMPGVEAAPNRFGGYGAPPVEQEAQPTPQGRAAGPSSIGDAIKPIVLQGRGGRRYQVDPLREQKIAMQGREMERNADQQRTIADEGRAQARQDALQTRQIQALTSAGMPLEEARARVLTGTVRYDESFGQYRPNNGNLTFEQRQQLQTQKEQAQYKVAQLRAAGATNSSEYRNAMLAISTANAILGIANVQAGSFDREATDAGGQVPKNPIDRQIATSTPEGAKRVATAESTATAARDSAQAVRDRGAKAAESTIVSGRTPQGGPRGPAPQRVKIGQAQYDRARKMVNPATKQPYTAAEIEKLYDIDPSVKRN